MRKANNPNNCKGCVKSVKKKSPDAVEQVGMREVGAMLWSAVLRELFTAAVKSLLENFLS